MKRFIFVSFLSIWSLVIYGQQDNLRQVIKTALYSPEVFDKVFFEYTGDSTTFMKGYPQRMKTAFVLPDTTLQRQIPGLLSLIGLSHGTENYFMTIPLLSEAGGRVFITSHVMDAAILLYIDFDRISIDESKSTLEFHTTSFPESKAAEGNHFKVGCDLIKRKKAWRVKNVRVQPIECCTPLW